MRLLLVPILIAAAIYIPQGIGMLLPLIPAIICGGLAAFLLGGIAALIIARSYQRFANRFTSSITTGPRRY